MPLSSSQKKVGHLAESSKNPTDSGRGRGSGLDGGQKRVGHHAESSKPADRGGKREVPGYRKGDQYNTSPVGPSRVGNVKRAGDLVGRSGRIEGP